ncbi:unnamed protein product [Vitrella brassicaformis CCMP3155]|uniref:Uncharacterized protein n=1 Tax=Vitrella brassicaformis (strain CCMP3155) TaxID=1169540 RepID=A0A0G4FBA5_VITBC|nr:unnamed protein product [Vitrella brassicaformis CCMP3155]|eukprot:CEM09915.1 unnamed protein product [Vitrella brassicaformis CCMP3155]
MPTHPRPPHRPPFRPPTPFASHRPAVVPFANAPIALRPRSSLGPGVGRPALTPAQPSPPPPASAGASASPAVVELPPRDGPSPVGGIRDEECVGPASAELQSLHTMLRSLATASGPVQATGSNAALDQMGLTIAGMAERCTLTGHQNLTGAATAAIAAPSNVPVAAPVSASAPGFSFSPMPYQAPHLRPPAFTYHHTAAMPHPPSAPPPAVVLPAPSPAAAHVRVMPNQVPLQYPTHHGIPGPGGHPMPPPGNTAGRTTRGACPWATHGRIGQGDVQ